MRDVLTGTDLWLIFLSDWPNAFDAVAVGALASSYCSLALHAAARS